MPLQYLASVSGFLGRDSAGGTGMALSASLGQVRDVEHEAGVREQL